VSKAVRAQRVRHGTRRRKQAWAVGGWPADAERCQLCQPGADHARSCRFREPPVRATRSILPGIGHSLAARRWLPGRAAGCALWRHAQARKNYAATSPITRASGKKKVVAARFIRNDRLTDALMAQAFAALGASPGARALYNAERASGTEHNAALRKLANRLVGILHGCLKTRTPYDEATAWSHHENSMAA
jgi:hypothetical protein